MSSNSRSRPRVLVYAACVGLLAPSLSRGDTVDASSTTMLIMRDQARAGNSYGFAPAYEILSVSARDIKNPLADNLQLVFSGWTAASIGNNLVWYDVTPPKHRVFGDVDLAFAQGDLLNRIVQLRVGRQIVAGGVTGMLQLDGANVLIRLPYGLGVSAYVGSPVSQRFDARGTETTFNPQRGSFALGGRAYWTLPPWGEIGASVVDIKDRGDPSRQQIGADLRLNPYRPLTLLANTNYDFYERRWAETNLIGQFQLLPKLLVNADYRHVEPDLFLPRDSILAVFSVDRRNEFGGGGQYGPWNMVTFVADYHYLKEESGNGHRANGRATWRPSTAMALGAEIGFLSLYTNPSGSYLNNGYYLARVFGSRRIDKFTGTLDLQDYAFQQKVNGERNSFTATATLAYTIGWGWAVLASASGGETPYYKSRFDVMGKVAYNQSYQMGEVRR